MKKILILSAVVPLFYSSCVCTSPDENNPRLTHKEAKKERSIAVQIKDKIFEELQGEGFFKIASSDKYDPDTFICDSYSTILYHPTSIEDARKVICRVVKEYLIAYNNDTRILALLNNAPITTDNLHISVYFLDNNHDTLPAPYISHAECIHGQISYYMLNDDEVSERVGHEFYEDARPLTSPRAATAEPSF